MAYDKADALRPDAGTIELWLRMRARTRFVASGTLVDGGGWRLWLEGGALKLEVGGLVVVGAMSTEQ